MKQIRSDRYIGRGVKNRTALKTLGTSYWIIRTVFKMISGKQGKSEIRRNRLVGVFNGSRRETIGRQDAFRRSSRTARENHQRFKSEAVYTRHARLTNMSSDL